MRGRILKFLDAEKISSAKLADDIGVQRSSVSHVLSGRNNPSFDFIQKILMKYKQLNAEWLILGTGEMYKVPIQGSLFDEKVSGKTLETDIDFKNRPEKEIEAKESQKTTIIDTITTKETLTENKKLQKVILFYSDNSFTVYTPENN